MRVRAAGATEASPVGSQLVGHGVSVPSGVIALDWDGVLRRGFLIMDWARHLQTRGQIEPTYVDQMERELERYRLHETTYSAIAT